MSPAYTYKVVVVCCNVCVTDFQIRLKYQIWE